MRKLLIVILALCLGVSAGRHVQAGTVVDAVDVQVIMPVPNGTQARAEVVVDGAGAVTAIRVLDPGAGYGFVPRVALATPTEGGTTPILGPAVIKGGRVAEIAVLAGGSGYLAETPPTVWIESPNRRALGRAVLTPEALTHVEILDAGSGYVAPAAAKNRVLGTHSWSGGVRVWVNAVNTEAFAPGQAVQFTGADGAAKGRGTISTIEQFQRGAPEGSDGWMLNLQRGTSGPIDVGDRVTFAGFAIGFRYAENATATVSADILSKFGIGKSGTSIAVENGESVHTLRGLAAPVSSRTVVRALGYYAPNDGGGGVFHWNPRRVYAMVRSARVTAGGSDYRPGDVVLLNGHKRFMVQDIRKQASDAFPEGLYTDHLGFAASGTVDVGVITRLIPVEHKAFRSIPKQLAWQNSRAAWSKDKSKAATDGPGSGAPFVKGKGELAVDLVWMPDNGGSIIAPCGRWSAGRWERIYESERNDIRFFGAIADARRKMASSFRATDNAWAIQQAVSASGTPGDPAAATHLWVPAYKGLGDSYLTGPININYGVDIKGGGGQLMGLPGQDILTTITPPIDYPFNKNNLRGRTFAGFNLVLDETSDATAVGGMAQKGTWKERRLYKAVRWDKERNSQRFHTYTFLEAAPVTDRRYFGTDDGLDPEEAPPVNDVEPARRIYHLLADNEYSDFVVSAEVDPGHRGFVRSGQIFSLEGGTPVPGSRMGPGKPLRRENFGHPDAGKARARASLFVPGLIGASYEAETGQLSIAKISNRNFRVPFLKGSRYVFSLTNGTTVDGACVEANEKTATLRLTGKRPEADFTGVRVGRCLAGPAAAIEILNGGSYKVKAESLTFTSENAPDLKVRPLFASDNPVHRRMTLKIRRGTGREDVVKLDAPSPLTGGKDCYPWRVISVTSADGTTHQEHLDYRVQIQPRRQRIVIIWRGDWAGRSPSQQLPDGEYEIEVAHFTGSPAFDHLPYPAWAPLKRDRFADSAFLTARGGKIVSKGANGLVTGKAYVEGKDYQVLYDAETGVGRVEWKTGKPDTGKLYLKYRKRVDDYDAVPWGSPKHLSRKINGAVLVDAEERFMGNFGWTTHSVNYPGYPVALGMGGMNTTFRDIRVYARGVTSVSGGINIWANYDGNHENLWFQDTNFGFVMPINLYYPWNNYGVTPDGSTYKDAPARENDVGYGDHGWGGSGGPDFLSNRYQSLIEYTGGSEQSYFKNFQFRCGDVGLFVVDSSFYEMQNIWCAGANAIHRPLGGVMVFGTPANGIEQFTHLTPFGPLGRMFGEQALNGDYALPVVRYCATGGREVDFDGVTQGRQVIWGGKTKGRGAGHRSTIMMHGGWQYSLGIWSPATLRVSLAAGSKDFAIEAIGAGTDGVPRPPLRHGAMYLLAIHDPTGERGQAQTAAFTYDAGKPLSEQLLQAPARFTAANLTIRVLNGVIRKNVSAFNAIEREKLNTHYGWSLLLCGDENAFQVSPQAKADRHRLILESGGENKITTSPLDE